MKPRAGVRCPSHRRVPVPGYSGHWWIETNSTWSLVVEDVVGAVAVVDVPVEDHHALQAVSVERVLRRHRDVVEQAEPHRRAGVRRGVPGADAR